MIHPTAIIDPEADLHPSVTVGPYSVIGPGVVIGEGTIIEPHVVIKGPTQIGARNHIFQFSSIGEATPDLKYKGEPTTVTIGNDNVIRENVTIHRGTVQDRGDTYVGNNNLIMCYVHIGHDSVVKDHTILVNNTALAGHVVVDDWAILSDTPWFTNSAKLALIALVVWARQLVKMYLLMSPYQGVRPKREPSIPKACAAVDSVMPRSQTYAEHLSSYTVRV